MSCAVIDIGANTIRFSVYKFGAGSLKPILTKKSVAGLATYIEKSALSDKGKYKLSGVLKNHLTTLQQLKVEKIYAFATASLRNTSNLEEVLRFVKNNCDIDIEVLSQDEEARLGFLGIQNSYNTQDGITVDIGGGSTEIVKFVNSVPADSVNFGDGCLSLYYKYVQTLFPTENEVKKIDEHIKSKLPEEKKGDADLLIGIGGTIRALGNILSELIPGNSNKDFTYDNLLEFYSAITGGSKSTIKTVIQVVPERIHTITTGTIILKNIMEYFRTQNVHVCDTGLREGFFLNKVKQ
ncbi:MAG: phosphatase [Treponema sp.]|nr:MAG: phosphatase [Treponema sp.]